MNKNLPSFFTILLLFLSGIISAQVVVTFPSDRAVFQRSSANEADVYIGGYITEPFTSIEARFVPRVAGEGQPAPSDGGWSVISKSLPTGQFFASMTVKGGWYKLEVRGIKNGTSGAITSVDHVGVGEVFVVAGQSNATGGDANPNGPGAGHDQVNSVNFQNFNSSSMSINPYSDEMALPCPEYVHLDANVKTAPFGNYAWCWGSFGDQLYEKLRVPVMIFNAGWSSSGIENWKQSIDPNAVTTSAFGYTFPAGLPFGHLRLTLNYYIAQLGVRAVLWHQGETDNFLEQPGPLDKTYENYLSNLSDVVNASRSLSGKSNLAWLVARASRFNIGGLSRVSEKVIKAQNELINNDGSYPHIYPGPETDNYYNIEYRRDEVHFRGDGVTAENGKVYSGLIYLAGFWADKITNDFLKQLVPYSATPPPAVSSAYEDAGAHMHLTAPGIPAGWKYKWLMVGDCNSVQTTSQDWTVGEGSYKLKVVDANNNTVYSPQMFVSGKVLPVTWQYFNAETGSNGRALLKWATESELNASHFEVERSTNAVSYITVKSVDAAGDSKYTNEYKYLDEYLAPGVYYYRLKQVDRDGKFDYSRIASVKLTADVVTKVYPNPVTSKLTLESAEPLKNIDVIATSGAKMFSTSTDQKQYEVDMQNLPNGLYTVTVNGKSFKIVK